MSEVRRDIALFEAIDKFESAQAVLGCIDSMLNERPAGEPLIIDDSKSMGLTLIFEQVDCLIGNGVSQLNRVACRETISIDRPGLTADPEHMPAWVVAEIDAVINICRSGRAGNTLYPESLASEQYA